MANSKVSVNFNASPPNSSPDTVVVNRGVEDGIEWTANQTGYTFTGVKIDGESAPTGDFGTPQIGQTSGANPRSVMTISDAVKVPAGKDYVDYSYTLEYTAPDQTAGTVDPTIRNKR